MITAEAVAIFSTVISFVSLLLVILRLHSDGDQRRLESLIRIYDINRQLLTLGFSHPVLFGVLQDSKEVDPTWERHYLQLWLNQMALIHAYRKRGFFSDDLRSSLERDVREFMLMDNMQKHWKENRDVYPASFRHYVNSLTRRSAEG